MKTKRTAALLLAAALFLSFAAAGCSQGRKLQIALVTDGGTIRDRTYNQGAWEGISAASEALGFTPKSVQPGLDGKSATDAYLERIDALYQEGYRIFVLPGLLFTEALELAQEKYEDCRFIAVDFVPATVGPNTVCLSFADEQAAFLAGFAAALELKEGAFGGIFGMALPAAQRSSWGFQQGVLYANENYGTSVTLDAQNFVYADTYSDASKGQQLAAELYDRGVRCIFSAAGQTGTGVITEARARTAAGETLWCIGVDVDQTQLGVYQGADSVVITSASKNISGAVQQVIESIADDEFPGGQTLVYDVSNDGVGIPLPEESKGDEELSGNLSADTLTAVKVLYQRLKSGEVTVSATGEGLIP